MHNLTLELRKFVAPEFIFGADARLLAGRYAKNIGNKKAFVVTDAGVMASGWTSEIINSLEAEGIPCIIYSSVSPNPRDSEVMRGAKEYIANSCDFLVAVGGGSPMDCAKGIGIVVTNQRDILDFEGVDKAPYPMPPLICVPTTAGTSADVSQFAIINNTKERYKIAVISKAVVPDVALIDPVTLLTMDGYLTACTGMDALTHAVEAYASNASSSVTDINAIHAIELIHKYLHKSVHNPDDLEMRGNIMLASLMAGLAFSNASLGCVHAMAHSLGGYKDLPHGECNALLLSHIVDYNFNHSQSKYRAIAEAMGIKTANMSSDETKKTLIGAIIELRESIGIVDTFDKKGVEKKDIPILADKAINDPCNATNPRVPTKPDMETLYLEAL